jgi:hypothetical protein
MIVYVKVFGCGPMMMAPDGLGAGVRKPSSEEKAGEMAPIGLRARKLWGFEGCGLGVGEWTNRSSALVDGVWVHERAL